MAKPIAADYMCKTEKRRGVGSDHFSTSPGSRQSHRASQSLLSSRFHESDYRLCLISRLAFGNDVADGLATKQALTAQNQQMDEQLEHSCGLR